MAGVGRYEFITRMGATDKSPWTGSLCIFGESFRVIPPGIGGLLYTVYKNIVI